MKKAIILALISLCLIAQNQNRAIMLADVEQPATPTDSPGGGTYSSTQSVTLSDATATFINYTTNGTTPACPSTGTLYTTTISVAATTTIKAIGCNGITGGGVLTSVYTITVAGLGPVDNFINCNTSSPGTTLTTTILNNCTQGNGNNAGWALSTSPITGMTIAAHQTNMSLLGSVIVNGTNFPTSTTSQSIAFDHTNASRTVVLSLPTGTQQVTWAGWIHFGPTTSGSLALFDYVSIQAQTTGYPSTAQLTTNTGSQYDLNIETGTGGGVGHSSRTTITQGGIYWISLTVDAVAGTSSMGIFDTSGTQVGSTLTGPYTTGEFISSIRIGNNETGTSAGTTSHFENFVVDFTGQVIAPVGPLTTSLPGVYLVAKAVGNGSGAATTTASAATEVKAGWTILAFISNENSSSTVSGVADTAGNTFTSDSTCKVTLATQGRGEMWWAKNATANAADVVTATHTSSSFRNIVVMTVSGANATSPFDVCATGTANSGSANITTASFTPSTSTGSNFMGAYITAGAALTAGTNYNIITTSASTSVAAQMRATAPNSSQTATMIQANTSTKWGVAINLKQ